MAKIPPRGLFVTGTDTEIGKTYVAALICRGLREAGFRVGVYKPVASGCKTADGKLTSDDALALWEAAGKPLTLEEVCPQIFSAPLAPHLAAQAEGKQVNASLLRTGLSAWTGQCDIVVVEGAGGLLSPLSETDFNADLARDFGYPLVVVSANRLGTINHTLQTLYVAKTYQGGLPVAGVILNDISPPGLNSDESTHSNLHQLRHYCAVPILAHVPWQADRIEPNVDWVV